MPIKITGCSEKKPLENIKNSENYTTVSLRSIVGLEDKSKYTSQDVNLRKRKIWKKDKTENWFSR